MSNFNPIKFLLDSYKSNFSELEYQKSFIQNNTSYKEKKLYAFCKSIISILIKNGDANYNLKEELGTVNIYKGNRLIRKYTVEDITFKDEKNLKFTLFVEWGFIMNLNENEKINIGII